MVGFGVVVGAVVGGVSPSSIGKLEPAVGLGEWAVALLSARATMTDLMVASLLPGVMNYGVCGS